MPQRQTQPAAQTQRAEEEAAPLASTSLRVVDYSGRRRKGSAIILPRQSLGLISARLEEGEDFRIIMLAEPPDGPVSPAEGVVVVAPVRPLSSTARLREAAAPYLATRQPVVSFPEKDLDLLRKGRLYARAPLQARPEDVFAGDKPRLALLARDLLLSAAVAEYLQAVAIALSAPGAAKAATLDRLGELQKLVEAVRSAGGSEALPELDAAASRLSQLASAGDAETLLLCAERLYPARQALTEDIYILRAFDRSPEQAGELLAVRRFLSRAAVPEEEADLTLDRSLLREQLTFAALATEPNRLAPATAALARFRQRYVSLYRERHTSYWAEMARLHTRLVVEQPHAEALRRINTLAELGPPAGVGALAAFAALLEETSGCPLTAGVEDVAAAEGACPACSLPLDQSPPARRVDEILDRIERACDRQMARLSSSAIQHVLRHSSDPRVDQFLKMVQASQLSSLRAVLDDALVGYLRRFLVESRIHDALEPILSRVQDGVPPNVDEAQSAMRDVSRVLQRAFQSAQRALPPGETEPQDGPSRRRRKR
ncbi:MAG: hypothetical protein Q7R32_05040 [Dehalococcoidia bacterium]|nr:hypothetical protein [Dehalococcoidia bacterium]